MHYFTLFASDEWRESDLFFFVTESEIHIRGFTERPKDTDPRKKNPIINQGYILTGSLRNYRKSLLILDANSEHKEHA